MKNNTSIIISLLGGIALGSVATCIIHKGCKKHNITKENIHKKIMEELEALKTFVAAHHSEELCSCEDPACNCTQE